VTPKVFLVAETTIVSPGMLAYLQHVGAPDWRTDAPTSAEALVEFMGRQCYRSWAPGMNANVTKVREGNAKYLAHLIEVGHGSVLEHPVSSWIFADVSRVLTHELVRHRAGTAFSQESLRFVRLDDLGLWLPPEVEHRPEIVDLFERTFRDLEALQHRLAEVLALDALPFEEKKRLTSAMRRVAPEGLATTIGVTFNMRALRHVAVMRTAVSAEAEFRFVMDEVMKVATVRWPGFFADFSRNAAGEWVTAHPKV
jgi:thymidylate synthase (FAD)